MPTLPRVGHGILNDIAICIVAAWLFSVLAQILKQPLILAYLAAGFIIGPEGVRLIESKDSIETISEVGLILLLFMIGLEIDLKKILGAGKLILLTGAAQIVGGVMIGMLAFPFLKIDAEIGQLNVLYLAVAAALSSTVIIVKLLYDKKELDTLPGRITLGVLILQDLFAILFLALQPNLKNPQALPLLLSLVKAVVLVVIAFTASRYALPHVFRRVARHPELVLVGSLAWCFLMAGLGDVLGLSREMGALIAGVAISTFPYTLDVSAKVTSLRDFFVTLFFVSLGMSIPEPSISLLVMALIFALVVILSRFLTVVPLLHKMEQGHRASILPAVNLSQVSEFSLVILTLGAAAGHISKTTVGVVAYAFVILAVASTYAINKSSAIAKWVSSVLSDFNFRDLDEQTVQFRRPARQPSIFVLGFSWTASSLLEELKRKEPALSQEIVVIDYNPQVNDELRSRGIHVKYGDITQRDTLHHAGIEQAKIVICTLSNTILKGATNLKLLKQVRELAPHAHVIVHAELLSDVDELHKAGASYVHVPRLLEAHDLMQVIVAAQNDLIAEKRAALERELDGRREVIS